MTFPFQQYFTENAERFPTLRLGTAQKASEVRYTLIIFSFSLINIKCCLSIISVLLSLFQNYHFTVSLIIISLYSFIQARKGS